MQGLAGMQDDMSDAEEVGQPLIAMFGHAR